MKKTSVLGLVSILSISLGAIAFAKEAPMLAERVASGELPPVEARLPKNPYVVGPGSLYLEKDIDLEIGKYGGTLRLAGPPLVGTRTCLLCRSRLCWTIPV